LLNGEHTIGITIHHIDKGIDTGDVYRQISIPVNEDDTGYSLYLRSMEVGAEMYLQMLSEGIDTAEKFPTKVQEGVQSYFGMIESHYKIDWRQSSRTIVQLVKIHAQPYFPAFAFIKNNLVLFNRCREYSGTDIQLQGPGIIRKINQDGTFIVSCGEGFLEVLDYNLAINNENRFDFIRLNAKLF
jgi:methionyl-tRNA formyltransferase